MSLRKWARVTVVTGTLALALLAGCQYLVDRPTADQYNAVLAASGVTSGDISGGLISGHTYYMCDLTSDATTVDELDVVLDGALRALVKSAPLEIGLAMVECSVTNGSSTRFHTDLGLGEAEHFRDLRQRYGFYCHVDAWSSRPDS